MPAFPKPTKAEQRAEDAARAQGLSHYEQVQALVQAGDLAGAGRAINSYLSDIVTAQLRLGDVAGASHTAQLIDRPEGQSQALQLLANAQL